MDWMYNWDEMPPDEVFDVMEEFDIFEGFDHTQRRQKRVTLSTMDYNLNSPLIADETDASINYLKLGVMDKRFDHRIKELDKIKSRLSELNIPLRRIPDSGKHHTFLHDILYKDVKHTLRADQLQIWEEIWQVTEEPVRLTKDYITQKTNESSKYKPRFKKLREVFRRQNGPIRSEWMSFLNLHFITCVMNNCYKFSNLKWVKKLLNVQYEEGDGDNYIVSLGNSEFDIDWIVTPHFVFHVPTRNLLSKNFLLMLKDVALGRFMSQLSMLERSDGHGGEDTANKLRELYDEGDKILKEYGNASYNIIKLIEPECTERWNQLGHTFRPLITLSDKLLKHLKETKKKNPTMERLSSRFFQIIQEEKDPWIVGQFYGAFRHWGHPYIDYIVGLKNLEKRVNEKLIIDQIYSGTLASDLVFLVLKRQFKQKRRWFAKSDGLPEDSPLKECIDKGVWPTAKVIEDYGDNWHKLKLIPCFEIPDTTIISAIIPTNRCQE